MDKYEEYVGRLRALLQNMEISSAEDGMASLDAFVRDYEESLYNEIGRLTRQLHDSLIEFQSDEKIHNLSKEEIAGAKERLKYVVNLTEQAAEKVIGTLEKSIPISLEIGKGASNLQSSLTEMTGASRQLMASSDMKAYLAGTQKNASILHGYLTDILMAQEYQDITGQIIKKVIDLVQNVEDKLVRLIKLTGNAHVPRVEGKDNKPSGPCVPDVDDKEQYTVGQDDVDQLLASLGF